MKIRWICESGNTLESENNDIFILFYFMLTGDESWPIGLLRLEYAYPDNVFFPVWERGKGRVNDIPLRFGSEICAFFPRNDRFRDRWNHDIDTAIKIGLIYVDGHKTEEYICDFTSLVEVLSTANRVPDLIGVEASYNALDWFPVWVKSVGVVRAGWPTRFQTDYGYQTSSTPI